MSEGLMKTQRATSHIFGGNAEYVDELYESYLSDPNSVSEDWRVYFEKLPGVTTKIEQEVPHTRVVENFELLAKNKTRVEKISAGEVTTEHERRQVRVLHLISAYRNRGHQRARLDPLGLMIREDVPDLELAHHDLSPADLDTIFNTGNLFIGETETSLSEILQCLKQTYCETVGSEYMHIVDTTEKRWIQQRLESVRAHPKYSPETQLHILERLAAAEGLEKYLGGKYPGTKRFGLEGGESLIPLLNEIIQRCGTFGTKEMVIGMAHRGRLNVLVNTLGKTPEELMGEFEGKSFLDEDDGSGDVKYHQGFSSNVHTTGGEIHLALAFNPSHLEIVSPVVEGSVRARQDRREYGNHKLVVPVLIHGDAAFAGQGVVMETFQMSQTNAYKTGGTVHVVINNQVGFTTSKREDLRSTEYCTDIAKMVQAPIFHVNGDDPEAVFFVTQMALDYRMEFHKDVVIDMVCYRRRGHNEADEPAGTQPLMYQAIKTHPTTLTVYSEKLIEQGVTSQAVVDEMLEDYRANLEAGKHVVESLATEPNVELFVDWSPYIGHAVVDEWDTSVDRAKLKEIAESLEVLPEGLVLQKQVQKIYDDRRKMSGGALPVNWGYAETMAYASLVDSGQKIRMTGQDCGRGTFSHRHAMLHNQKDGSVYIPLQNIHDEQGQFYIHDSFLSEEAVLAFEYGYATTTPDALVIWEAQFGDFANGAQVVIDQFISSGELKWGRLCGLTMLLPHGYEGQGPEHSSARLERFMQLCAEYNIQVCMPTSPSQIFHLLRRQSIRPLRKPLIVMTPKSLLRHRLAISTLDDLAEGQFETVLDETEEAVIKEDVCRMVICSGKVFYDLLEARNSEEKMDTAIIRIEQLYPFPEKRLSEILAQYVNVSSVVWCQEEPRNQGAWYTTQHHLQNAIQGYSSGLILDFAGREASAAPAVGDMSLHARQQSELVKAALMLD